MAATHEDPEGGYVHDEHLAALDEADRTAPRSGLRGFINNHKVGVAVGGTALVAGVVTAVLVTSAVQGPMAVDQEAVDIFNAKEDPKAVAFYDSVCAEVTVLSELPRQFATADSDSIGMDLPGRAEVYTAAAADAAGVVKATRDRVARIDDNAPVVDRVDGSTEGADYRGALTPVLDYLDAEGVKVSRASESPKLVAPATDDDLSVGVDAAREAVTDVPGGIAEPLQASMESASLFSEATQDAVVNSMSCRSLLNPDAAVDPDTVVAAFPELLDRINQASTAWSEGLAPLRAFSDGGEQSYADAVYSIRNAWESAGDGAEKAVGILDAFAVHEDDEKAQRAAAQLPGKRDEVRDGYAGLRDWAQDAVARIDAVTVAEPTQADVDALDAVVAELGDEFTERNLAQQKLVTSVGSSLVMPNEATAQAARDRVPEAESAQK